MTMARTPSRHQGTDAQDPISILGYLTSFLLGTFALLIVALFVLLVVVTVVARVL
jgi:hypothetical protein